MLEQQFFRAGHASASAPQVKLGRPFWVCQVAGCTVKQRKGTGTVAPFIFLLELGR